MDGSTRTGSTTLGADAEDDSRAYLRHYYDGFLGDFAEMTAQGALSSESAIRDAVTAFEDAGMTELYVDPITTSLDQIGRLGDLVL